MPRIRSDDGPRKLRAVWLGPKGSTLPFEWTYVQWLVCLVLASVCSMTLLVAVGLAWAPIYGIAAAVMYGTPAGFWLGVKVMKGVSYDEPFTYRAAMIRDQLRRHPALAGTQEWRIAYPPITDLSPGARRALTGTPPE